MALKSTERNQDRAEITRAKIMGAATRMFSEQGFDAVSVRDIENAADVYRGLLAYHFDSKEALWQTVVDAIFGQMKTEFDQRLEILEDMSPRQSLAFVIRFYVRFHDRHPELSRLMSQEARQDSWRIRYLIENHIRPASEAMQKLAGEALSLDRDAFIHWYYIMISASSTIFSFAPECQLLFGVDSHEEDRVKAHSEMLVAMLLSSAEKRPQ